MQIIDTHAHRFGMVDEYFRSAKKFNVVRSYVSCVGMEQPDFTFHPDPPLFKKYNDQVFGLMKEHAGFIQGMCYVNPVHLEESLLEIDRCIKCGMAGIKLWVSLKADHDSVSKIAEAAVKYDVPVLLHTWLKITGNMEFESTPDEAVYLSSRHPDLKLIMAHAGGDWEYGIKTIRKHKQIYTDFAMSVMDSGMVELGVELLGEERILWGTDSPVSHIAAAAGKILDANIPGSARAKIFSENAKKLFSIKD